MNPQKDSTWEEEFDKRWNWASFTWNGDHIIGERSAKKTRRSIKTFIRKNFVPLSTLHTLEDKIRGMKVDDYADYDKKTHNAAIDSVLQEIRKMYES